MKLPWFMRSRCRVVLIAGLGGLFTVINPGSAEEWTATSAPFQGWRTVACSADGAKLVAAGWVACGYGCSAPLPIYTSFDSGATWTQTVAPSNAWSSVACSANATIIVASADARGDGSIYVSGDSGASWLRTSAPSNNWACMAGSADGTKWVAAANPGPIYVSTNSGTCWFPTGAPITNWTTVASSADGGRLVAAAGRADGDNIFGAPIYVSTNSGRDWISTSAPITNWAAVASSADGRKLFAVATGDPYGGGGPAYGSTDYGVTWTQMSLPVEPWHAATSSAEGDVLVAGPRTLATSSFGPWSGVYVAKDSGVSWTTEQPSAIGAWNSIAISADGNRLVASGFVDSLADSGMIYTAPYSGPWKLTTAPITNWSSIACSEDGNKLVAAEDFGLIYTSTDAGVTWAPTSAPVTNWSAVASSADGSQLVAAVNHGLIYSSCDFGVSWKQTSAPSKIWAALACSVDGTRLLAAASAAFDGDTEELVYISADSGITWTPVRGLPSELWSSVASSEDGTRLVALAEQAIYTSTDSGTNWSQQTLPNTGLNWTTVRCSVDGNSLLVAASLAVIWYPTSPGSGWTSDTVSTYISTNFGATWTQSGTLAPWLSVSSSSDDLRTLLVANGEGALYGSTNFGRTWFQFDAPAYSWRAAASSADGSQLVVAAFNGPIATLQFLSAPPVVLHRPPHLDVVSSARGPGITLSWIVPSADFVLQQGAALDSTNWTNVPATPMLNFTNLHYEVTLQPSLNHQFFRLKSQ